MPILLSETAAKEIKKIKHELYAIIAHHTEKEVARVEADCDRDFWLTAEESKAYGVVDEVLVTNPRKEKK